MKIKQTLLIMGAAFSLSVPALAYTQPVNAEMKCGGATTSIIDCPDDNGTTTQDNGVWHLLIQALNIMTAGVGILAVAGIAYGAALYASSADKPEQAKQGMAFIKNVVIGLIAYGLMFVLLNFLVPGGVFDVSIQPSIFEAFARLGVR
jgi:hypothetical protein